ncbi:MAG: hypothetical protein LBC75_02865 [Fibromonadaceae bacterium]|jgi:hypothetical protein|nr:hypothetical protein [Fibromonadaceae bacterium]
MKKSCRVVLFIFLLALFANAEESPIPLPSDNSLTADSLLATKASEPEKAEKKAEEKKGKEEKTNKKSKPYNPEDYQKNLRTMVYLHPLQLFYGAAANMFMFSSTIEKPLNLNNSVVIQPVVWLGSSDGYIPNVNVFNNIISFDDREEKLKYESLVRIGSGIGLRHYILNKAEGFYLQAIVSAYYFSAKSISSKEDDYDDYDYGYTPTINIWTKVKGVVGEFMLYTGMVHKWENLSFLYEIGLGFGYDGTKTRQMGYINSLATNLNINIGMPF